METDVQERKQKVTKNEIVQNGVKSTTSTQ